MVDINAKYEEARKAVDDQDKEGFMKIIQDVMQTSPSYLENLKGEGKLVYPNSAVNNFEIAPIKQTSREEYDDILDNSRKAQEIWASVPVSARQTFLKDLGEKLKEYEGQIGFAISSNVGKGRKDSETELGKAIAWGEWANKAETAKLFAPEYAELHNKKIGAKVSKPAGVVGVMTSFNYPLALSLAGIVPAILTGNSVIFKSASKAPHWAFFFQDAFEETMDKFLTAEGRKLKLSDEEKQLLGGSLFSVINGRQNSLDLDADNIFFVGGTETGQGFARKREEQQKKLDADNEFLKEAEFQESDEPEYAIILRQLAEENGSRKILTTHLELGGNSAMIVLESAFDGIDSPEAEANKAEEIAQMLFDGAYGNSGQRCTAARMIIFDESKEAEIVCAEFLNLVEQGCKVGNPFDPAMKYGALVDSSSANKIGGLIECAQNLAKEGQDVSVYGGGRIGENASPKGGMYFRPGVIDWRGLDIEVMKETKVRVDYEDNDKDKPIYESLYEALRHETFGPLVNLIAQAKDKEHAVALVKEWDAEGLAAGAVANDSDLDYLQEKLVDGGVVTSLKRNGTPKDPSPAGAHGNVSSKYHTGGEHFYESFTREVKVGIEELKEVERVFDSGRGRQVA